MAVFSLMALASSSGESTSTSFAPVRRMALSNALLPPAMTTSCFSPVVSGSCQICRSLSPAMHAAVAAAMAPAEPEVTMPDSAPVNSASRRPARAAVRAYSQSARRLRPGRRELLEIPESHSDKSRCHGN